MDKTSSQCMYNIGQIRAWSLPHLKTGSWYIDCGKGFCPEVEEDLKASIDAKDTASGSLPSDEQADKGNDDDADLAKMSEKDRKKEDTRRAHEKEKEKKKKEREDECAKEKAKCADVKAGKKPEGSSKKSKDAGVMLSAGATLSASDDTHGINLVTLSTGSLKRDAAFVGLSISRMQFDISKKMKDCVRDALNVDEFFFRGSFLSIEDHHAKHNKYPREWLELIAFLEKVRGSPYTLTFNTDFDSSNQITSIAHIYHFLTMYIIISNI
jgi:hypothetical protein